ncbi:hypothetical protein DV735_g1266, partial [Chaetothyriales sp. CBS 134920]
MSVREADHAGSWYSADGRQLANSIDNWLAQVPDDLGSGRSQVLPVRGARAIIAPHAGYAYSGPAAAWAYKALDLSSGGGGSLKRIFILHPSHHHGLSTAALPTVTAYRTPLAAEPLPLDLETIRHLASLTTPSGSSSQQQVRFTTMSRAVDEAEHSAEMQLPFLHRLLQRLYPGAAPSTAYPRLSNAFVISSDFCHWGARFQYTYYVAGAPSPASSGGTGDKLLHKHLTPGTHLDRTPGPGYPRIYESIAHVDRACMCAIATGEHAQFVDVLRTTGNTVCGRHPIGVFMAAVEEVKRSRTRTASAAEEKDGIFHFIRYERSSDCTSVRDSSVSYVSAYALL